jgi:hypothetical protein
LSTIAAAAPVQTTSSTDQRHAPSNTSSPNGAYDPEISR